MREAFDPLVRARERIVAEDATELRVVARFSDVSVVTCRHCRHMEDAHRPDGSCEVEVSDWGTLDCTCPGFEPMQP